MSETAGTSGAALHKALTRARSACAGALTLLASRFGRGQAGGGVMGLDPRRAKLLPRPLVPLAHTLYTLIQGPLLRADSIEVHDTHAHTHTHTGTHTETHTHTCAHPIHIEKGSAAES